MRCFRCKFALLAGLAMCATAAEAIAQSPGLLAQAPRAGILCKLGDKVPRDLWSIDGAVGHGHIYRRVPRRVSRTTSGRHRGLPGLSSLAVIARRPWIASAVSFSFVCSHRSIQPSSLSNRKSSPACQNPCCFF